MSHKEPHGRIGFMWAERDTSLYSRSDDFKPSNRNFIDIREDHAEKRRVCLQVGLALNALFDCMMGNGKNHVIQTFEMT